MEDLQALDQHCFSLTASIMIPLIIFQHPKPDLLCDILLSEKKVPASTAETSLTSEFLW